MSRLELYDYRDEPFKYQLAQAADSSYRGYFHYHQGVEFLYVHDGQGTVTLDQQIYRMEPGTLFVFQPYQLHHVSAQVSEDAPYVRSVIQFDPLVMQKYLSGFAHLGRYFDYLWKGRLETQVFPRLRDRHPIDEILRHGAVADPRNDQSGRQHEWMAALLIQLLQFLYLESFPRTTAGQPYPSRTLAHIENILQWVEHHYAEPYSLERAAEQLHLSKYHISHLFKAETGRTVTEYMLARRVKEACRMLTETSLPVAEIGARVGWPIASHFTQQFKRWAGMTPLQYRKQARRQ